MAGSDSHVRKKAIIYMRLANISDADLEGDAFARQRAACLAAAGQLDAEVVGVHADSGYSGTSALRPGLNELLAELRGRQDVAYVIVSDLGRWSRQHRLFTDLMQRLNDTRVRLVVADQPASLAEAVRT
ncbi:MAG: Resolvase, terminal domain [Frankiaceae bacterium]|jgi:DNA invertase Pin-like site-specific DNA recombinase|nr:Resolvase, terminal domain [Frankiaceae bacterium]